MLSIGIQHLGITVAVWRCASLRLYTAEYTEHEYDIGTTPTHSEFRWCVVRIRQQACSGQCHMAERRAFLPGRHFACTSLQTIHRQHNYGRLNRSLYQACAHLHEQFCHEASSRSHPCCARYLIDGAQRAVIIRGLFDLPH